MKKTSLIFIICFISFFDNCFAQNKVDSLISLLKNSNEDTIKVKLLFNISGLLSRKSPKEAMIYIDNALLLGKKLKIKKFIAISYNTKGTIFRYQGEYDKALVNNFAALKIYKNLNDKSGIASVLNNIGNVYFHQGDYSKALKNYLAALRTREETGDKQGIAVSFSNVGMVYGEQGDFKNSLNYFQKSLEIRQKLNDQEGIAISLNNIGEVFLLQGNYRKAVDYHLKSLIIREEIKDKKGTAESLIILGDDYLHLNDEDLALKYFKRALKLFEVMEAKNGIGNSLLNIGRLYYRQNNSKLALEFLERGLVIAREIEVKPQISQYYKSLSDVYGNTKNYAMAYNYHKRFSELKDSILNEETSKQVAEMRTKYETGQKEQEIELLNTEKEKQSLLTTKKALISAQESSKQKVIIWSVIGSLCVVLIFAIFILNRWRVTQRQKMIIEQQKILVDKAYEHIEVKNKEITDSINYAERIQRSFLATEQILKNYLKEHFVFFKPKDIVSGDFYWATPLNNGSFALVTADSTGHGVPGAIMSILNISCLKETVKEGYINPADILNNTRSKIIEILKQDGSAEGGKDGMDCSLIAFDFNDSKLTYASANNPVWIIRNNEIMELSYDKMPVGKHQKDKISFNQNTIELKKGDLVYTITDGMPDQFGGPDGKKYLYKQLKKFLISIAHLRMEEQKNALSTSFDNWKGNFEQVDDVCVIGIRV